MDAATEKLQWSLCVFCGAQKVQDPTIVDKLMGHGKTREEAEAYVRESGSVYLVCPNREQHTHAHPKGFPMVPLEQLEHGAYYTGKCRNAVVARWNAETQKFIYMREKFRFVYPEEILYWVEGHHFDEFRPYAKLENPPFEIPLTLGF